MKPEDIEKIKKEIKEGGIPLQIYSSVILNKLGWYVKQNSFYNLFNKKGESEREIDVIAERESFLNRFNDILILECKKSTKPWVFFKQGRIGENPFVVTAISKEKFRIYDFIKSQFKRFHYLDKNVYTYFHTAFFKENDKEEQYSPIHKAIKQALGGFNFIANQNADFFAKNIVTTDGCFLYPIIVLDGKLISADVKEDGEIDMEETNHISLILNFEMEEAWIIPGQKLSQVLRSKPIIIDIVKKEHLEEFLKNSFPK